MEAPLEVENHTLKKTITHLQQDLKESGECAAKSAAKHKEHEDALNSEVCSLRSQINTAQCQMNDVLTQAEEERVQTNCIVNEIEEELLDCQNVVQAHVIHRGAVEDEYRKQETSLQEDIDTANEKAAEYKEKYESLFLVADRVPSLEDHIKDLEKENTSIASFSRKLSDVIQRYIRTEESPPTSEDEESDDGIIQFSMRGGSLLAKPCQRTDHVTPEEVEDYFKEAESSKEIMEGKIRTLSYQLDRERRMGEHLQQQLKQVENDLAASIATKIKETSKQAKKKKNERKQQENMTSTPTPMKIDDINELHTDDEKNKEIAQLKETLQRYEDGSSLTQVASVMKKKNKEIRLLQESRENDMNNKNKEIAQLQETVEMDKSQMTSVMCNKNKEIALLHDTLERYKNEINKLQLSIPDKDRNDLFRPIKLELVELQANHPTDFQMKICKEVKKIGNLSFHDIGMGE